MIAAKIDVIEQSSASERRAAEERVEVAQPSTLRTEDAGPLDVVVDNLSSRGFRFASDRELEVGASVRVGLSGAGTQLGTIVWRKGKVHGCTFSEPLSQRRMRSAFRSANIVAGRIGQNPLPADLDDGIKKWSRKVRLGVLMGGAAAAWAIVFMLARLALG